MKELLNPKTKFSNFDLDKDGVVNQKDCNPFDKTKTDYDKYGNKIRLYRGYNVDDWFYDVKTRGYVLRSGAKPVRRGIFG